MRRLLLDANLSPETSRYLASAFDLDVIDLLSLGLGHLSDPEVADLAARERRVVITFDLDWGEIYHQRRQLGVIILRLADQTVESVNRTLEHFFRTSAPGTSLEHSLVIVREQRVRIVSSE